MNRKVENLKNNKNKNKNKKQTKSIVLMPPPFRAGMLRRIQIRFVTPTALIATLNMNGLAQAVGCLATTATASYLIAPLTKLNCVRIWSPVTTAGTPVTCSLTWVNMSEDFQSPPTIYSDTSVSYDRPAHINQAPPNGSLSSKWHSSSLTDSVAILTLPAGSTVDLFLGFVLMDDMTNFASIPGPTLVGAIPGQIYHHPIGTLIPQTVNQL
jgi:hypothetical protein